MIKRKRPRKKNAFKKVMIIDDDSVTLFVTSKLGKNANFADEIITFSSPVSAIDYIKRNNTPDTKPDVIFLDIYMPVVNGWDLLSKIRDYVSPEQTKIFIHSSSIKEEDRQKAVEDYHVKEFIPKPMSAQIVEELKERHKM